MNRRRRADLVGAERHRRDILVETPPGVIARFAAHEDGFPRRIIASIHDKPIAAVLFVRNVIIVAELVGARVFQIPHLVGSAVFPRADLGSRGLLDVLTGACHLQHPVGVAMVPDAVVIAVAVRAHLLKRPAAGAVCVVIVED